MAPGGKTMSPGGKPTAFTQYLEEKRKLTEAAQNNPDIEIDTSPKRIVKDQKHRQVFGSPKNKIAIEKENTTSFQDRVLERISTAKSGTSNASGGGIAYFDQGVATKPAPYGSSGGRASPTKTAAEPTATVLSVSSPLVKADTSKPVPHVTKPQSPLKVASPLAAMRASQVSAACPTQPSQVSDSVRPFTSDSKRLNQPVTTPKYSSVSPGLILSQQNTATRSASSGLPPPSAGGSIVHAMETSRTAASGGSRLGTGQVQIRPGTGASAGRLSSALSLTGASASKMAETMQERLHKIALTNMARNGKLTEEEYKKHLQICKYNNVLAKLKEKINVNGNALGTHFSQLDVDGNGVLDTKEFRRALQEMNLGEEIDDFVFENLMKAADIDSNTTIDYGEFAQALRIGEIPYMALNPNIKTKTGPDPDNPLGDPGSKELPFAIQSDAKANILKFDARIDSMYKNLEETFLEFDEDNSGEVDWPEFKKAMYNLREKKGIHLADEEVKALFRAADYDHSGAINWQEFVQSFQGGAGKRFIPEFMKPKSMRCSMVGAPWEWRADPLEKYANHPTPRDGDGEEPNANTK